MSIVPRNPYGFPHIENVEDFIVALNSFHGDRLIGYRPKPPTKLERAQAYAADVRARKFPAPCRITPTKL